MVISRRTARVRDPRRRGSTTRARSRPEEWFDEHVDEREMFAHCMMGIAVQDAPVIAKPLSLP